MNMIIAGAKSIVVTSRRGEILLEVEATDESFRDTWVGKG